MMQEPSRILLSPSVIPHARHDFVDPCEQRERYEDAPDDDQSALRGSLHGEATLALSQRRLHAVDAARAPVVPPFGLYVGG
jgi:hypothetical protein